MSRDCRFHLFSEDELSGVELPSQFTYPFHYVPHPLCKLAADKLMNYISSRTEWKDELESGKMMGVMPVGKGGKIGFLAAYSGNLAHTGNHEYFVPAVYDLLDSDGFFVPEEKLISELNNKIKQELTDSSRVQTLRTIEKCKSDAEEEINSYKHFMKESKRLRDLMRLQSADEAALISESQFQKAQLRRLQKSWSERIDKLRSTIEESDRKIKNWKLERQQRSVALQRLVFDRFVMLNGLGERRNLNEIFSATPQGAPPSGAGECAAPKMLQYAYANGYQPLAMAEFWVGKSPKTEVRHHGYFYPACKAKCEPILKWMLQGLDVEPNKLETPDTHSSVKILYEDEWIIAADKPAGMLSVPGKLSKDSLVQCVRRMYNEEDIAIVHRLDMATSGILILARSQYIYKQLQSKFKSHKIEKCYAAILEGNVSKDSGIIELPLILNPDDRPRQMVNYKYGKRAVTRFEVKARHAGRTSILFYPLTGRTHQLRVHAAHCNGLNAPILGDMLYGRHDDRLYLHAHKLKFIHPVTHKEVSIISPIPFDMD